MRALCEGTEMSDRELLEAAAKASGITLQRMRADGYFDTLEPPGIWNALQDDGDALRLAVKLRIQTEPWIHGDSACARAAVGEVLIDEPHYGEDPDSATRRAIVRAAAAIGGAK
jgi:hypothetical protein